MSKINKVKADWLGPCPGCGSKDLVVFTKYKEEDKYFADADSVICECGSTGEIGAYDDTAIVEWDSDD